MSDLIQRGSVNGYLAFAPDLYHGELAQPGDDDVSIPEASKDAWERAKKFFKKNLK